MNVVDSCGWLEYFAGGPNADFFAVPLADPDALVVPSISMFEVFEWVYRQRGEGDALLAVSLMEQGTVVDLGSSSAIMAATLSVELALPMADAIMLSVAREHRATLWTQDSHFVGIEGVRYVAPVSA